MAKLSVNLNAVAQLRNRRTVGWPSVTHIARLVLDAGAAGLTVHPRPDERHIRRTDVFDLKALLDAYPAAEFNIEGYPAEPFLALVETACPDQVTLVPDDPSQTTSDHGWPIRHARGPVATGHRPAACRRYPRFAVHRRGSSPAGARPCGGRGPGRALYRTVWRCR